MINGPLSFKYARKRQEGLSNALAKAQIYDFRGSGLFRYRR